MRVLVELVRSSDFARVLFVCAHGGNAEPLAAAVRQLRDEGHAVWAWSPRWDGDAHAGRVETSLLLALAPELVGAAREPGNVEPLSALMGRLRAGGVRAVAPNGILGDPRGASAEEGRALLATATARAARVRRRARARGGATTAGAGAARRGDRRDAAAARARDPPARRRAPHAARAAHRPPARGARGKRVALVTGAARGIGEATVRRLVLDGWHVVAVDRAEDDPRLPYALGSAEQLAELASERVQPIAADVTDPEAMQAAVDMALKRWGGLDAIVAAAGVIAGGANAWELDAEQERAVLEVNLGGVMHAARVGIPALLRRPEPREGRFIAVASAAAVQGLPMLAAYCASKAGVTGFIRALAVELGRHRASPPTRSAPAPRAPTSSTSPRGSTASTTEAFAAQQPLGRLLEPDEVAALIAWLASPQARGATGGDHPLDGGTEAALCLRLVLDASVRLYDGGRVLVARGRIIRLTDHGPAALRALLADTATPAQRRLGDRLVRAGMAHPRPRPQHRATTIVIPVRDHPLPARSLRGQTPNERNRSEQGFSYEHMLRGLTPIRGGRRRRVADADARRDPARDVRRARRPRATRGSSTSTRSSWPSWTATRAAAGLDRAARRALRGPDGRGGRAARQGKLLDMGEHPAEVRPGTPVPYVPTRRGDHAAQRAPEDPFDPALRYGEDVDLIWRLIDQGWRVRYDPSVRRRARGPPRPQAALPVRHVGRAAQAAPPGQAQARDRAPVAGRDARAARRPQAAARRRRLRRSRRRSWRGCCAPAACRVRLAPVWTAKTLAPHRHAVRQARGPVRGRGSLRTHLL